MNGFESLIQRWDQTLKKYNSKCYDVLYPPLPAAEILSKLNELGCSDEHMKAWFAWKNGIDPDAETENRCMIFNFRSMPLSLEAMQDHAAAGIRVGSWTRTFIPMITNGMGEFYLFNNLPGADYGKIYLYSASLLLTTPQSCYDSLTAMLETTIQAYEQGAFIYDSETNWLNSDSKKYRVLAQKINTHSEYWRSK